MKIYLTLSIIACILIYSCKLSTEKTSVPPVEGRVPVATTHPEKWKLVDSIELNATSDFLSKTFVKSTSNGYLKEVNVQLGQKIGKGENLFVIQSTETQNSGSTTSTLDSNLQTGELTNILSNGNGYITKLDYQAGDYVQAGETLANISDISSLVFLLELPNELAPFLPQNLNLAVNLPNGQKLSGTVTKPLPIVDTISKTQNYIIKVYPFIVIPENHIAKVTYIGNRKNAAISLPKEAILTNEIQSEFWIMKMTDSITAVKVVVDKGVEASGRVEILSPKLKPTDLILLTGNLGLPDTASVSIIGGE